MYPIWTTAPGPASSSSSSGELRDLHAQVGELRILLAELPSIRNALVTKERELASLQNQVDGIKANYSDLNDRHIKLAADLSRVEDEFRASQVAAATAIAAASVKSAQAHRSDAITRPADPPIASSAGAVSATAAVAPPGVAVTHSELKSLVTDRSYSSSVRHDDRSRSISTHDITYNTMARRSSADAPPAVAFTAQRATPRPATASVGGVKHARLTSDERNALERSGGCTYCRLHGHLRPDCPIAPPRPSPSRESNETAHVTSCNSIHVPFHIDSTHGVLRALIDTDSQTDVISSRVVQRLRIPTMSPPAQQSENSSLGMNTAPVSKGTLFARINFRVQSMSFTREFRVAMINSDAILGAPFMNDTRASINWANSTLSFPPKSQ